MITFETSSAGWLNVMRNGLLVGSIKRVAMGYVYLPNNHTKTKTTPIYPTMEAAKSAARERAK